MVMVLLRSIQSASASMKMIKTSQLVLRRFISMHDPVLAGRTHDGRKVAEGAQRLEAHHHLARAAGEDLERARRRVGPGVDQQRSREAGLELRQLPEHRALHRAALDGIEVRDVAAGGAEPVAVGAEERDGIALALGHDGRHDGLVARALTGPGPHGHAA